MMKSERKRLDSISAALNAQIAEEERRILRHCSFFAFVGPAESFHRPRKITESIKPEAVGRTRIPESSSLNTARRNTPTSPEHSCLSLPGREQADTCARDPLPTWPGVGAPLVFPGFFLGGEDRCG